MLGTDNYAFLKETEEGSRWMAAIQEKQPFTSDRLREYASNGTYYFKTGAILKKYFKQLMALGETMKVRGEYYVSVVYNLLVADGLAVSIFEINHMLQWGTPYDLAVYQNWSRYFRSIIEPQEKPADRFNTTLILPMAGAGSRFAKKGYSLPKPLIEVNGKSMIVQAVNCLPATTKQVFICLAEHLDRTSVGAELEKNYKGCLVKAIPEITQGQASTSEWGINQSGIDTTQPILISACDNGVYYDPVKYQDMLEDPTIDIIVWTFRNNPTSRNNPHMYAWLETDDQGFVKKVSCKQFIEGVHDLRESHVIIGTMFFRKAAYFLDGYAENFKQNSRTNGEFYVDDVLQQNITRGLRVKVFEVEHYICWGTPDDYETYCYWLRFFHQCAWHPYGIEKDSTFG
jgi:bifunctional N-acetylglucosamine-1-phosphate-uridyltransferase/glucosamine-1-phosphate-acetyltransferase GlmU-like protein